MSRGSKQRGGDRDGAALAHPGILLCFFLSGFAALVYQTAWLRQLSLVFGTSELAVAAVLAAYMGGLALGAGLAARLVDRVRRPVMVYGLLEGGIAMAALAVPLLLAAAGWLYVSLLGGKPQLPDAQTLGQPVFYLIVAFVVLLVPTALMGTTLPLLARHAVRSDVDVGPVVAVLYATNTVGAVAGTLVAAFALLPRIGLMGTVLVGVGVNAAVFVVAALLARGAPAVAPREHAANRSAAASPGAALRSLFSSAEPLGARLRTAFTQQSGWVLPLMLISGANAFLYEVLWTRMLAHVLGGSIYAFATMLAAFLAGIAIGGGGGGAFARDRLSAARALTVAQAAIALSSIGVYAWMQALVPDSRGMLQSAVYAALVMLPATIFIGATFPLAVRVLAPDEHAAARSTARVYSWNTIGAIAGAVLAAFWVIPVLGFAGSVKLAVTINLALAVLAGFALAPVAKRLAAAAALGLVLVAVVYWPTRPQSLVGHTAFDVPASAAEREIYFAIGRSSSVLLNEADGHFDLRTNGLPEGSILPRGAAPVGQVQQWLSALPLVARPDSRSLLLVGLGGGVALEGIPSSVEAIDVVELEPEVIAANRRLAGRRLQDPLQDPRVTVVVNDARNALRLSSKRYDIVASQPSHPWTAGASHLFSREFFTLAKGHLNDGGVFLQWMSAGFVDEPLLRSLTATLVDVFGHVRLYQPAPGVLLFLASDEALPLEASLAATGLPVRNDPLYFSYMRLSTPSDLVAALMLDEDGARAFAAGAPPTTDDRNRMATDSRSLADGLSADALDELLEPHDLLADAGSWVHEDLAGRIDFAYVASRLLADGRIARAQHLVPAIADPSTRAVVEGLVLGSGGNPAGVVEAFRTALRADPDNQTARYALIQPALAQLALGIANDETTELAAGLSGSAAAVVRGWTLAAEEDWPGLSALDAELAQAVVTDLWFPEAARLRADWRIRVVGAASSLDAIRILDRAVAIRPSLELLILRASAADTAEDAAAFVESARYALRQANDELDAIEAGRAASRAELDTMFRRQRALRVRLAQLPDEGGRLAELSGQLGDQLARIQVLMRPRA